MIPFLLENLIDILGIVVAGAGIFLSVRQYIRSKQLEIFSTYVGRYNSIVRPEIYDKWQAAVFENNEDYWEELQPVMIAYLNLVWEEAHLRKNNLISQDIWEIWKPKIQEIIESRFAEKIAINYKYPDLYKLVNSC